MLAKYISHNFQSVIISWYMLALVPIMVVQTEQTWHVTCGTDSASRPKTNLSPHTGSLDLRVGTVRPETVSSPIPSKCTSTTALQGTPPTEGIEEPEITLTLSLCSKQVVSDSLIRMIYELETIACDFVFVRVSTFV